MDKAQIAQFVQGLITEIGEDPGREGLRETPQRVAKSFEKLFEGYGKDPKDLVTVFDNEGYSEMVVARDIDFYSLCEHHMLPFYGKAEELYSLRVEGSKGADPLELMRKYYGRSMLNFDEWMDSILSRRVAGANARELADLALKEIELIPQFARGGLAGILEV